MVAIERLDWDSCFFNKEIGKIIVDKVTPSLYEVIRNRMETDKFDLVYLIEKEIVHSNNQMVRPFLKDTKLVFQKEVILQQPITDDCISSFDAERENLDTLYHLAIASGEYSRYKVDPRFSNEDFVNLYKKWVNNSLNRTIADDVFVYREKGEIVGLVTVKYSEKLSNIGLIAVDQIFRGKSIGSRLLRRVENETIKRGCRFVTVSTQLTNELACSFYKKNEYNVVEYTNIYHIWK